MLVGVLQVGFYYFPPKNVAIEPFTTGLSCCLTLDFFLGLVLLIVSVTERFKEVVIGAFGEACDENVAVDALDVFSVARARTFANMPCKNQHPLSQQLDSASSLVKALSPHLATCLAKYSSESLHSLVLKTLYTNKCTHVTTSLTEIMGNKKG